jgi:hypothetical protein
MRVRSAFLYTVLRLLAFLVPFSVLMLFPAFQNGLYWLAAIFAALIGLSLSLLFLRRPLESVSGSLAERRAARAEARGAQVDADSEDAVDDARRDSDA